MSELSTGIPTVSCAPVRSDVGIPTVSRTPMRLDVRIATALWIPVRFDARFRTLRGCSLENAVFLIEDRDFNL